MCSLMLSEISPQIWIGLIVFGLAVALVLALLPGSIARDNGHANPDGVNLLSFLGLLFLPLWFAALIWAIVGGKPRTGCSLVPARMPRARSSSLDDDDDEAREFEIIGTDESGKRVQWTMLAEDADAARFAAFERNITVIALRPTSCAGPKLRGRTWSELSFDEDDTSRTSAKPK